MWSRESIDAREPVNSLPSFQDVELSSDSSKTPHSSVVMTCFESYHRLGKQEIFFCGYAPRILTGFFSFANRMVNVKYDDVFYICLNHSTCYYLAIVKKFFVSVCPAVSTQRWIVCIAHIIIIIIITIVFSTYFVGSYVNSS